MLVLLRIVFTTAWAYCIYQAARSAEGNRDVENLGPVLYLGLTLLIGLIVGAVWTPYLAQFVYGPLTDNLTDSTYVEPENRFLKMLRWAEARKRRKLIVLLCFLEGIFHPNRPHAFIVGLQNAKPGSWLEKVFAREVFRFGNGPNCELAAAALRRHGIDPGNHRSADINLILFAARRVVKPDAERIAVPRMPAPNSLKRNPKIRIFTKAEPSRPTPLQRTTTPTGTQKLPLLRDITRNG